MNDLPASHYLNIYEHRLSMSDRGITKPTPKVITGMRRLVEALKALRPQDGVALDVNSERVVFMKSDGGAFVAQIDFDDPQEQQRIGDA